MEEALDRRCVADTSLLNNFVHSGSAYLLDRLLGRPVQLSPTILDVQETLLPGFPRAEPASEFLRPLYMAGSVEHSDYRRIAPFIQSFALSAGELWEPVEHSRDELLLAARLSSKKIRAEARSIYPGISRRKVELDPGEAEAAAIAITRGWTFLTDDQASAELLRGLYPDVPVQRTCHLLTHAAEQGLVLCNEAADLFNRRIVDELGFWAFRKSSGARQRLWLRCDPSRCSWEPWVS